MTSVRYRVAWTDEAEGDAHHIVGYFADRINADRVIARFDGKAMGLVVFPQRERIVPELERIGIVKFRETFVGPWRMLYEVRGHDGLHRRHIRWSSRSGTGSV